MVISASSLTEQQREDIWELVKQADKEFIPPLSARRKTTQQNLDTNEEGEAPKEYFDGLIKQNFILCIEKDRVVGFVSYIKDHSLLLSGIDLVCDYISTVVVSAECRNKGYTQEMYMKLFRTRCDKTYATRTWSTNASHIRVLKKLGFDLVLRIENDRGKGIDTVYYLKEGVKNA